MSIMKSGENSNTTPTAVLYVGIDVAKATLAVNAGSLCERTIPNTPEAIHALAAEIRRACPSGTVPHFCAEPTCLSRHGSEPCATCAPRRTA